MNPGGVPTSWDFMVMGILLWAASRLAPRNYAYASVVITLLALLMTQPLVSGGQRRAPCAERLADTGLGGGHRRRERGPGGSTVRRSQTSLLRLASRHTRPRDDHPSPQSESASPRQSRRRFTAADRRRAERAVIRTARSARTPFAMCTWTLPSIDPR
jgi:hypothetical protein